MTHPASTLTLGALDASWVVASTPTFSSALALAVRQGAHLAAKISCTDAA
jgi:hypothetical protein